MQGETPLVVILGPTATGKTRLSVYLAHHFKGEIISADSMQIYQGMNIGTATPSREEQQGIPHHLLSVIPPDTTFSVADFQKEAQRCIEMIHTRGQLPFLVGGTGLYIRATLEGFIFPAIKKDEDFRSQCQKTIEEKGSHTLHAQLKDLDQETAQKIHPHDERRIIRALEIIQGTDKTPTYFRKKKEETPSPYRPLKVGLTASRPFLYQCIEKRVEEMVKGGLIQEVKHLLENGYTGHLPSMHSLGYREMSGYLRGEYSKEEAISLLKRNTRRFAKRQLTWFKKEKGVHWFSIHEEGRKALEKKTFLLVADFLSH